MLAPMQGVTNRAVRQVFAQWVRPDVLFTEFLPALRQAGFTEAEIQILLVANPRDAFTLRVRHH